jgi:hypothetical protein
MGELGSGTFDMQLIPGINTTPKKPPSADLETQMLESYRQKGELQKAQDEAKLYESTQKAKVGKETAEEYARQVEQDPTKPILQQKVKERADMTFVPTKENAGDLGLVFTLTNILGFMIGGKSKGNAQAAMSAMNGMLEGHNKGMEDLYKKEKIIFEENSKALDKTIEALDRQLKEAMQTYATNRELGMQKAEAAIAEHNAQFLGDALKKNGLAYTSDFLTKAVQQNDKRELAYQRLKDRAEDKRIQQEHYREIERQGRERLNLSKEEFELKKQTAASKLLKTVDDVDADLRSRGVNISSAKDRAEVAKVVASMAELQSLRNDVINNPNLVGRQGQIKQFVDRYLKSFKGESPPIDESKIAQEDQEALLFSKKYASMLTRYEQALAGGAKGFTVALQRRFNDLLSQNQFNAPSMARLFDDMSHEIAAGARQKSNKLTYGILEDMAANFQSGLETPKLTVQSQEAKTMPSGDKLTAYAKKHFGGDVEKAKQYLSSLGYK